MCKWKYAFYALVLLSIGCNLGSAVAPTAQVTATSDLPQTPAVPTATTKTRVYTDSVARFVFDVPAEWFITPPNNDPDNRVGYATSYDMANTPGRGGMQDGTAKLNVSASKRPNQDFSAVVSETRNSGVKIIRDTLWQLNGTIPALRLSGTDDFGDEIHVLATLINGWKIEIVGYGKIPNFSQVFDSIARTLRPA